MPLPDGEWERLGAGAGEMGMGAAFPPSVLLLRQESFTAQGTDSGFRDRPGVDVTSPGREDFPSLSF